MGLVPVAVKGPGEGIPTANRTLTLCTRPWQPDPLPHSGPKPLRILSQKVIVVVSHGTYLGSLLGRKLSDAQGGAYVWPNAA